jgi:hypothetical protein
MTTKKIPAGSRPGAPMRVEIARDKAHAANRGEPAPTAEPSAADDMALKNAAIAVAAHLRRLGCTMPIDSLAATMGTSRASLEPAIKRALQDGTIVTSEAGYAPAESIVVTVPGVTS